MKHESLNSTLLCGSERLRHTYANKPLIDNQILFSHAYFCSARRIYPCRARALLNFSWRVGRWIVAVQAFARWRGCETVFDWWLIYYIIRALEGSIVEYDVVDYFFVLWRTR